jgi:membrane protein required for beta-lactamase induction
MEHINNIIKPLIDKIETLSKTQIEIYKFRIMLKTSSLMATMIFIFLISFFLLLMAITLNIALAHCIGGLLGNIIFGYLIVSLFYAIVVISIYCCRCAIHSCIQDNILHKFQN